MEMMIDFPGGAQVDAHFGPFTVHTDQPSGNEYGSGPTPFEVFLSSLGTCAGIYVLGFCRQRGLPTEGIRIIQRANSDRQTGMVNEIEIEILVPPTFPEKYYEALVRSADQCKVKKHMENPPHFKVHTTVAG